MTGSRLECSGLRKDYKYIRKRTKKLVFVEKIIKGAIQWIFLLFAVRIYPDGNI